MHKFNEGVGFSCENLTIKMDGVFSFFVSALNECTLRKTSHQRDQNPNIFNENSSLVIVFLINECGR